MYVTFYNEYCSEKPGLGIYRKVLLYLEFNQVGKNL